MDAEGSSRGAVMVIEDDPDIRAMMTTLLEMEGYGVEAAASGKDALERLRTGAQPSLILLDLMMPAMSGWQFREEQRADPALSRIPVVVMSGDAGARASADAAGAAGFLKKPVDLERLLATVRRFAGAAKEAARQE